MGEFMLSWGLFNLRHDYFGILFRLFLNKTLFLLRNGCTKSVQKFLQVLSKIHQKAYKIHNRSIYFISEYISIFWIAQKIVLYGSEFYIILFDSFPKLFQGVLIDPIGDNLYKIITHLYYALLTLVLGK